MNEKPKRRGEREKNDSLAHWFSRSCFCFSLFFMLLRLSSSLSPNGCGCGPFASLAPPPSLIEWVSCFRSGVRVLREERNMESIDRSINRSNERKRNKLEEKEWKEWINWSISLIPLFSLPFHWSTPAPPSTSYLTATEGHPSRWSPSGEVLRGT